MKLSHSAACAVPNVSDLVSKLKVVLPDTKIEVVDSTNDDNGRDEWGVYIDEIVHITGEHLDSKGRNLYIIDDKVYKNHPSKNDEVVRTNRKVHEGYAVAYYVPHPTEFGYWCITNYTLSVDVAVALALALYCCHRSLLPV